MVKSATRRDAEILARNPSPTSFGENFGDSKKYKQTMKKRDFKTGQKRFPDFEILQNIFPRPTFFKVPFGTPKVTKKKWQGFCNSACQLLTGPEN